MISKIQYISQPDSRGSHITNVQKALDAGCTWIQLRIKNKPLDWVYREAESAKVLCKSYQSRLIINDFIQLAKDLDSDGVHLGLQDGSVTVAREILGWDKIIGGTANTFDDVVKRSGEQVDYIGLGPYAFTQTKEKLSPILGLLSYEQILAQMKVSGINIPIIAIGGIQIKDMRALSKLGIYGFAISGLLNSLSNPEDIFGMLLKQ
ncbi:thiamine-phosphate diphosphorylase [Pseudopedobacter saltans DSM 12145]|uniref:Thiamine-phosphate synthase n=1 Tax=Pseudopedobacter saltans (strain ATCC 51119 / DSM 12145 / JCM 21818 / CCUG 39354 / LMG 10337 / NBRC 100064 / NCIMB 13643) TaxID=762903 RepID=F0SEQ8_PSESL|nr:thiamine phosphate synthase [Pseudopedobacter saltans]ADY51948.1 thiamine-phosphate diphosphorylase [Pseudopedobacter saltans DSM 12145]